MFIIIGKKIFFPNMLVKMNICENCPNKSLCKAGVVIGVIGVISSSFMLIKKLHKKLTKKNFPGPNIKDDLSLSPDVNL